MSIGKRAHESGSVPFMTATHELLFQSDAAAPRCDACGAELAKDSGDAHDEGFAIAGRGLYMWTRGDEVRVEDAPLCPSCASAIGMSALARWEIEEEEG